jgi:hypothetical protein
MNSRDMLLVWAKSRGAKRHSPHPLLWHMLDTAAVCEALGVVPALAATPPGWLPYLAALHDIGKADPLFLGMPPNRRKNSAPRPLPDPLAGKDRRKSPTRAPPART